MDGSKAGDGPDAGVPAGAPSVMVALSTATPSTNATLTAASMPTDPAGRSVELSYVWSVDGTTKQTHTTTSTTDEFDLSVAGQGDPGDTITVSVTPDDGVATGLAATANAIVSSQASGSFAEYAISGSYVASGIFTGPDGNVWFTLEVSTGQTDSVGKISPTGVITLYPIPSPGNSGGITAGSDGNLWFTEFTANKLARITPGGTITEFAAPAGSGAGGVATGAGGELWVMFTGTNQVAKLDPAACTTTCTFTRYNLPTAGGFPHGPRLGPDGNIWFAELNADKIAKVTSGGTITEYAIPTAASGPDVTAPGPDGNVWFTEQSANRIARVTPGGVFTEFDVPTANAAPDKLTVGADGNLWFTEHGSRKIGRITP